MKKTVVALTAILVIIGAAITAEFRRRTPTTPTASTTTIETLEKWKTKEYDKTKLPDSLEEARKDLEQWLEALRESESAMASATTDESFEALKQKHKDLKNKFDTWIDEVEEIYPEIKWSQQPYPENGRVK